MSKDIKKEIKWFNISQYEEEEKYLSEKHRQGWKLVKIKSFGVYYFEKCEPEDVKYQLDYNQEGLANKEEYIKMYKDMGWEYVTVFGGYSYFKKPVKDLSSKDEGIFCDNESKLDMLKRVMKGRLLPMLPAFVLIIIPQLLAQNYINGSLSRILFYAYIVLLIIYLLVFAYYGIEYNKLKDKIENE